MKNFTSLLGWLLLAAILAVPSFLFYNWWATARKSEAAVQAPVQRVSTAVIFAGAQEPAAPFSQQQRTPPAEIRPVRQSSEAVTAADRAAAAAGDAGRGAARAAQPDPPAADTLPAGEKARTGATAAPAAEADRNKTPSAGTAVSTQTSASYFNPKSSRDPTISPAEYRKIKADEEERREAERQRTQAIRRRQSESGGESRIKLQGIMGSAAIINGEKYSAGNIIQGVKLIKVGDDYVICEYKGKRFKKVLR